MCLSVPGKLISISEDSPIFRTGKVSFGGIQKEINLAYVPEARIGDFVLVHVGFAIGMISETDAQTVFSYLDEIEESNELPGEFSNES